MTKSDRDSYKDAGAAGREAIVRTLELNPRKSTLQVLLALVAEVTTWSRLGDSISRSRIVALTGLSSREVTRAVNWLKDHDIILWFPGGAPAGGHRTLSKVMFPRATGDLSDHRSEGSPVTPQTRTRDLSDTDQRPGGHRLETSRGLTTEKSVGQLREAAAPSGRPSKGAAGAASKEQRDAEAKQLRQKLVDVALWAGTDGVPMEEVNAVVTYLEAVAPGLLDTLIIAVEGEAGFIGTRPRQLLRWLLDWELDEQSGWDLETTKLLMATSLAIEDDRTLGHILKHGTFPPVPCQDGAYWEATK